MTRVGFSRLRNNFSGKDIPQWISYITLQHTGVVLILDIVCKIQSKYE